MLLPIKARSKSFIVRTVDKPPPTFLKNASLYLTFALMHMPVDSKIYIFNLEWDQICTSFSDLSRRPGIQSKFFFCFPNMLKFYTNIWKPVLYQCFPFWAITGGLGFHNWRTHMVCYSIFPCYNNGIGLSWNEQRTRSTSALRKGCFGR